MSFANVLLWCNRAVLFFVSVAKENKEIIVWLKKNALLFFLFSNSQHNLQSIKSKKVNK